MNKPESGKIYRLTAGPGVPCILAGDSWADSVVKETKPVCPNCGQWQDPDCLNECKKRGFA